MIFGQTMDNSYSSTINSANQYIQFVDCDGSWENGKCYRNFTPGIIIFVYWTIIFTMTIIYYPFKSSEDTSIKLQTFAMSSVKTAKFMYQAIIRISFPKHAVNLDETLIDLDFYDDKNLVAPGVRFAGNQLIYPFSDVTVLIGRIAELNHFATIRCSHNGDSSMKFLVIFMLVNEFRIQREQIVPGNEFCYLINDNIEKKRKNLQLIPTDPENLVNLKLDLTKQLSNLEVIGLISMIISLCFLFVYFGPQFIPKFFYYTTVIGLITFLATVVLVIIIFIIALIILKSLVLKRRHKAEFSGENKRKWLVIEILYLFLLNLILFCLTIYLVIDGIRKPFLHTLYWFSISTLSFGSVLLAWSLYENRQSSKTPKK